ncbi:hypothetical protein HY346_01705 [Candidatus Microgenomates bacterium]|nr:hypothetical protein [Candidatus Microgenomates bacterium]
MVKKPQRSRGVEIVPTITVYNITDYNRAIRRYSKFAHRISIDLMDGQLAPTRSINPIQAYWPTYIRADLHLMYREPLAETLTLISLNPHLVVIHAEADGNLMAMIEDLAAVGIKTGLALLPPTQPHQAAKLIKAVDHLLIFGGQLGSYGGQFDPNLLDKVAQARSIKPDLEISWDGGVNLHNARQIVAAGVDVLNVGGYIARAHSAQNAYARLVRAVNKVVQS